MCNVPQSHICITPQSYDYYTIVIVYQTTVIMSVSFYNYMCGIPQFSSSSPSEQCLTPSHTDLREIHLSSASHLKSQAEIKH